MMYPESQALQQHKIAFQRVAPLEEGKLVHIAGCSDIPWKGNKNDVL